MKKLSFNPLVAFAIWAALVLLFNRHEYLFYGMSAVSSVVLAMICARTKDGSRTDSNFV